MRLSILLAGILFILLPSCKDITIPPILNTMGTFNYTAYDTLGRTVARGTLTLHVDSSRVSGSWQFEDGRSGDLEGTVNDNILTLNLNPRFVDNNLILRGTIIGNIFAGGWQQIGFPGITAQGKFSATRTQASQPSGG